MFSVDKALPDIGVYTKRLRDKAKSYGKIFEDTYPDINAFSPISNYLVLTLELLDYYYRKWWNEEKRQYLRDQDIERIVTICKWAYINSFSIVEYISKELVKKKNCSKFAQSINNRCRKRGWVSFNDILATSKDKDFGLVDEHEWAVWDSLKEIRNAIVHNNAIFDRDGKLEYKFDNQPFTVEYKRGKGLIGNMHLGLILVEILIELYYRWVQKLLQLN